jgi:chemotaxis response regulator CheB
MTEDAATRPPIRVLVVDDSAFMRTALSRMIASESGFEVAATACSGSDALDKIASLDPDVVTLDVEMPGLDGLQTLRCIMNQFPRPVIMVSAVTEKDADKTFNALAAGAFDYVPKQLSSTSLDILHIRSDLIAKLRAAAQSRNSHPGDFLSKKPPRFRTVRNSHRNLSFRTRDRCPGNFHRRPESSAGDLASFPSGPCGPHPGRAAHATGLYRSLCTAA